MGNINLKLKVKMTETECADGINCLVTAATADCPVVDLTLAGLDDTAQEALDTNVAAYTDGYKATVKLTYGETFHTDVLGADQEFAVLWDVMVTPTAHTPNAPKASSPSTVPTLTLATLSPLSLTGTNTTPMPTMLSMEMLSSSQVIPTLSTELPTLSLLPTLLTPLKKPNPSPSTCPKKLMLKKAPPQ